MLLGSTLQQQPTSQDVEAGTVSKISAPGTASASPTKAVAPPTPEHKVPSPDADRRAALRQAGAEYLQQALQQAAKETHDSTPAANGKTARRKKALEHDPEFLAFEQELTRNLKYLYMAAFTACTAICPLFIKTSLYSMQTPAVLLFLHMLFTALLMWLAASYDVFDLPQLTGPSLRGAAIPCALWSLQMLCVFSTLHHSSVNLVVVWSLVGREAVQAVAQARLQGKAVDKDTRNILLAGAAAAVLEFLFDTDKVFISFIMMLLWTALVVVEAVWAHLKADPQAGGLINNFKVIGFVRQLSDDEEAVGAVGMAYFKHTLPCVPILLLGFVALEGRELVDHELSVPAVTVMLLACACHAAAVCCELLLQGSITPDTKLMLRAAATAGTLLLFFLEEVETISRAACLCAVIACGAALTAAFRTNKAPA